MTSFGKLPENILVLMLLSPPINPTQCLRPKHILSFYSSKFDNQRTNLLPQRVSETKSQQVWGHLHLRTAILTRVLAKNPRRLDRKIQSRLFLSGKSFTGKRSIKNASQGHLSFQRTLRSHLPCPVAEDLCHHKPRGNGVWTPTIIRVDGTRAT